MFEGLYVGALNVLAAAAVILLATWCPTLKDDAFRTKMGLATLAGFVVFYYMYQSAYKMKNPWYRG